MKRFLVQKYVAFKMAQYDELCAEAKALKDPKAYVNMVMEMRLSEMNGALKKFLETTLCKRLEKKDHVSIYFNPTIGQWTDEFLGRYSTEDIFSALSQFSGLKPSLFMKATFGRNLLYSSLLIDIIETFEQATGKKLLKNDSFEHLGDDYSFMELAEFFATVPAE